MVSTRRSPVQTKLEDFANDSDEQHETKKRSRESSPSSLDPTPNKIARSSTLKNTAKASTPSNEPKSNMTVKYEDVDEKDGARSADKKEEDIKTMKKSDDTDSHSEPITINRAPVLTLFASCSAQLQYPKLSWKSCLSIGSAISSICAISKGRSIGVISEKEANKQESHGDANNDTISVLKFDVPMRDGFAYVGKQKKAANESYLKDKFGARYDEVKNTMNEALKSWKGNEEEFTGKGFHMYEKFRPGSGQWGQAGGLQVEEVRRVITR